ncbi:MAG TPA: hypothetical protein VNA25_13845 [Phycisphaerae bacterium]|nr:hypothetical protein [Phycisphaerae bacterium]
MIRRNCAAIVLAAAVCVGLLCAGCGGHFSRENFDTIYEGQPAAAVQKVLGKPAQKQADEWIYIRRRPHYYEAHIWFSDARVVKKRHAFDPMTDKGAQQ